MKDAVGLDPNQIITATVKEYNFPSMSHHLFHLLLYVFLNNMFVFFSCCVVKNETTLCKRQMK